MHQLEHTRDRARDDAVLGAAVAAAGDGVRLARAGLAVREARPVVALQRALDDRAPRGGVHVGLRARGAEHLVEGELAPAEGAVVGVRIAAEAAPLTVRTCQPAPAQQSQQAFRSSSVVGCG